MKFSVKKHFGIVIQIVLALAIICLLIFCLYPFIWMVINSFKSNMEIFGDPLGLPGEWDFGVFATAWEKYKIGRIAFNTLRVTVCVVVLNFVFSSLAAFATSHMRFAGKGLILSFCIGCYVVSGQILLTPLFKLLKDIGLYSTYTGLILVTTAFSLPMSIYLFHGFFSNTPKDLFESAKMDGCRSFRYFVSILLPISKLICASVVIFQSLFAWNEFLFAMTFLRNSSMWTITPFLNLIFTSKHADYNLQFAALTICVVPLLVLYVFFQSYFISGLTAGAVKG